MPIYEFVCEACGRLVERLQKVSDPPLGACPECGAKMAKIMSRNSFQLKGGGWYRDLYASGSASGHKGSTSASSGEAGPGNGADRKAGATPAGAVTQGAAPAPPASAPKPAAS
jgi:putative FmdB family regulatory protein